jgi:LuxR family maltose regulon positive regulatory protein
VPTPLAIALTSLINALADLSHDVALVLDDYHAIETPAIHDGLIFLLDDLPPATASPCDAVTDGSNGQLLPRAAGQ